MPACGANGAAPGIIVSFDWPERGERSMPLFRKLQTLRTLDRATRRLALWSIALSALLELGFRLFGVAATQGYLAKWAERRTGSTEDVALTIQQAVRSASIARRNARTACLSGSMALWALLLRRGIATELKVGFRRTNGLLEGHAWVERDGLPLNEEAGVVSTYSAYVGQTRFDAWA